MYFKLECYTPYAGTDQIDYLEFDSEEEGNGYGEDTAAENAGSYSYLASGWGEDFENEEAEEDYYSNCGYILTEVSKEEFEENS